MGEFSFDVKVSMCSVCSLLDLSRQFVPLFKDSRGLLNVTRDVCTKDLIKGHGVVRAPN